MSESRLYLGIDTSCYTTSLAAVCGEKVINIKKPLMVKEGDCGLRQSDAVFQHIKNLPLCFEELSENLKISDFSEVVLTVSSRPRNVEGSYMPVFLAGQSFARTVSATLETRYFETSHQEGHIMAAIHSSGRYSLLNEPFLTYHLSGGTTELLLVIPSESGFDCKIIGGTLDLPAGQFVDRIGVKLGLKFPCGIDLDRLSLEYQGIKTKVKSCVKDEYINFSGEETRYERLIEKGESPEFIAYCVMKCISNSVAASIESANEKYGVKNVLLVGGVSSSKFMRKELLEYKDIHFAEPNLSTDNAVGVAFIGKLLMGERLD